MCCRRWVQKSSSYIYLQANNIRKKQNKTKQNKTKLELCYALRSMSVLIAVKTCCCLWCYLPEWTSLHFCQRLKIEKRKGFGAKLYPSQFSTTFELCISIEWISKFALYVSRGARENVWLNASEADASGRRRSFIILCKKNPIIELICEIYLAYIVRFEVHMSG